VINRRFPADNVIVHVSVLFKNLYIVKITIDVNAKNKCENDYFIQTVSKCASRVRHYDSASFREMASAKATIVACRTER